MRNEALAEWTEIFGEVYGTEDQAELFYSLTKMQSPLNVLELGTGFGVTAYWMAQAMKENGGGHIWSVDNGEHWASIALVLEKGVPAQLAPLVERVRTHRWFGEIVFPKGVPTAAQVTQGTRVADYWKILNDGSRLMDLQSHVTFLKGSFLTGDSIEVSARAYPFLEPALKEPIDILFADVEHSIQSVLVNLSQFLPLMSDSSSIFIDSASTWLPSYLTFEQTIQQLNNGKLPAIFLAGADKEKKARLLEIVATRRFTLIPLVEKKNRGQNGLAWIKIDPINVVPYPLTAMRGVDTEQPVSRETLRDFFERGKLIKGL
jgi:hypothetical protein